MTMDTTDRSARGVGNGIVQQAGWTFSGGVADVFLDHVRQSVPTYDLNHDLACAVSAFFCKPQGRGYDLGTSTGQLLIRLVEANAHLPDIAWVGYDCEPEMIALAEKRCRERQLSNVTVAVADIAELTYEPCDFVSAYLVLQFLPIYRRERVVRQVFQALRDGGAFFLFEKIHESDTRVSDLIEVLHHDFKLAHGLRSLEIVNKARALATVLEPRTSDENLLMLEQTGFRSVAVVSRYLCFEAYLAIK
jgi:tRNA (cmo5U34)-methyltransferase